MLSLSDVPTEVIDIILKQVSSRELAGVSLASRKLYHSATPLLYAEIDFSIDRNNPRPLVQLCRGIFHRPELATHVKSVRLRDGEKNIQGLYFDSWHHQHKKLKANPPPLTDQDGLAEFASFITNSRLSYADIWIQKLRESDLNAIVALLISQLTNLVRLRVGYAVVLPYQETTMCGYFPPRTAGENQFLGKIFQSAMFDPSDHGLSRSQRLEDVRYPGPLDGDPGRNPDLSNARDMMALLNLPSIRSVSGWCLNPDSPPHSWRTRPLYNWPSGPPDLANLTSLSLSFVSVKFLAQIIERTQNLRRLNWEWKFILDVGEFITDTIDLEWFVEALKPAQDTLEDLTIGATQTRSWDTSEPPRIYTEGTLSGLRDFTNIKVFKTPSALLLPDWYYVSLSEDTRIEDSMPPNVQVITLTDATIAPHYWNDEFELANIRHWLTETATAMTPHLEEVRIYLAYGTEQVEDEQYDQIVAAFDGTNVKYSIIKEEDEKPWEDV